MRVLITGGMGFIGHWLTKEKSPDIKAAVLDSKTYNEHWETFSGDCVIHLAPVPIDRVLEYAMHNKSTVLLASSGGVYDREPDDYFRMKKDDELKLLGSNLDVRIARIFTTCGAHMQWGRYAVGNFIMQASAGGPIQVQSHGVVVRSYMYGSDLAEWLWTILLHGEPGGIYNVGSDVPHSTQELAFEVASHYDPQPQINVIRQMQFEPRPFYVPDTSRAQELGLSIKVPFEEAIRRTVEDYRNEK